MLFGNSPSDFGFLPPQFTGDVQMFFSTGVQATPTTNNWQTWVKPRGISMVYMIAIGGGGGGGGGFSGASGTARGGGGGGACSGFTTLMMPAIFLPDSLRIIVGDGGRGGAAGGAGTAGGISYISLGTGASTGILAPNIVLASGGTTPAGGGAAGAGAGTAAGGTAATVSTIVLTGPFSKLGFFSSTGTATNSGYAGIAGGNGGVATGAAGTSITAGATIPLSPGAGGGGINTIGQGGFSGGSINISGTTIDYAEGQFTTILPGSSGNRIDAGGGIRSFKPFFQTGAPGGGSVDFTSGGNGGNGGIGCGGGGGGGGTTGGRGGDGGGGMVAIISW